MDLKLSFLNRFTFLLIFFTLASLVAAQDLKISREVNIRNDYSYEILNGFGDRTLLVRDRNRQFFVDIFDQNLEFLRTDEIIFDQKRVSLDATLIRDSLMYFFHSYSIKDTIYICARIHDSALNFIKTDTISRFKSEDFEVNFNSVLSENESSIGLYQLQNSKFVFLSFTIDGMKITPKVNLITNFKSEGNREKFRSIRLKNNGDFFILFENNNDIFDSEKHVFNLFFSKGNDQDLVLVPIKAKNIVSSGIKMIYNEKNDKLAIIGLYGKKRSDECEGIYLINDRPSNFQANTEFKLIPFEKKLIEDLYGKTKEKKTIIRDHVVVVAQHRSDGGIMVVSEMQKEYNRRGISQSLPLLSSANASAAMRSQMDFYHEDLVVISINPDMTIDWSLPLFKKQFSQDDFGVFSSFFHFSTQNRIRLIFNDEIKNNNTVSEYVFDPSGKYERHTILNTDYKELKLRFKDAIQTSYNEFIVPSERNYKISLVKVKI